MLSMDFYGGNKALNSLIWQLLYQGTKQNPSSHRVYILAGKRQTDNKNLTYDMLGV